MLNGYLLATLGQTFGMQLLGLRFVRPDGERASLHTLRLHFEQRLVGSHGGGTEPDRDIPRYLALAGRGAFDPLPMVDRWCRLPDVNAALEDLRNGRAVKCMIDMRERA